ncbi:ribonuclease H-like domain-containing protein [Tanacetum coccineum]
MRWIFKTCTNLLLLQVFPLLTENGNSFQPVAKTTTNADGTSTTLIPGPVTADEKIQKKNDVKARSMLLMALPNEHLMTFNQYKDAKTLFAAIQTRFGANEATKKTQKILLKQMYENFNALSIESLDFIFNRLQKIRNKLDLDTMSFDDLYNNFKIVEQEVKGTAISSSQNLAFMSSTSSTNEVNTAYRVSTANTQVSTASTQVSTANLSDDTVYAFLASQPNGSQLVHDDLEQIHEDDLEEMDLKWQLALLSMRTRRFFQKTSRKITINGSDTAGYDKSKVECFNCNKMRHFARKCRGSRSQDNRNRNQDSSRRTINVEETSSKAMLAIDGSGFDWSDMANDEVPTNMALMAFSDSEILSNEVRESLDAPLVEELVSNDKLEKKTIYPTDAKIEFVRPKQQEKPVRETMHTITLKRHNYVDARGKKSKYSDGSGQPKRKHCPISHTSRNLIEDMLPLVEELKEEKLLVKELLKLSIMKKMYCLVVTDDFSRFSWVFFLATKDETSGILKAFITGIENQINHRVKIIRCDNGTEFKNKEMNQFCEMKGIKREFSVARTPQQNGVAERKNRTLIEAARTMLADSKLPTTFWAEAVNTACYVQNRVLVIKPHNKTPYELFNGRPPTISFMRLFRCLVTILNTLDHLGKFDEKADEGFFVGYSVNSKAFRVFNSRTRIVEETLHIIFLENKPNITGSGPEWIFDIDTLTKSMNYKSVVAGNQTNGNACTKESIDAGQAGKKTVPSHEYILLPLWTPNSPISSSLKSSDDKVVDDVEKKTTEDPAKGDDKDDQDLREFERLIVQGKEAKININNTNSVSAVSSPNNTAGTQDADVNSTNSIYTASPLVNFDGLSYFNANPPDDQKVPNLEDTGIFGGAYDDEDFVVGGDMNNLESFMPVSPIATTRVHKDHLVE